ncbi:hypothetical protein Misp01_30250 [Microtetraspora sp. NBRC 13810]|uniref:hypothetical protein n=1 Tax=Microtetraspora sp. NBRC 13810 TaxID=3030990 RepID=UPI00249FD9B3|nr:hypothetical protein [Microtetraspora sp. NBRC 13810]GLW07895.1 hypothetical protein Misp01_30250 [Microtetraspora sp. NBRC 13810]
MNEHQPYTLATASIDEEGTRLSISFNTPDLSVTVLNADHERPFLNLANRQACVSITTTGAGPVTAQDLTLARELFNAAARYLSECERLHTGRSPDCHEIPA